MRILAVTSAAPPHAFVVWQLEHGALNSADPCGGFVVALKFDWWHVAQSVGVPR